MNASSNSSRNTSKTNILLFLYSLVLFRGKSDTNIQDLISTAVFSIFPLRRSKNNPFY